MLRESVYRSSGSQRSRERGRERGLECALVLVGRVLEIADVAGLRQVSARPGDERVHPLGRVAELLPEHPDHVGRLRKEPALHLHESHLHTTISAAAMSAVPGTVVIQAIPIWVTTDQRMRAPVPAASQPGTDHGRRHDMGGGDRRADDRRPEDRGGRAGLTRERVEGAKVVDPLSDSPHDPPAAEERAGRHREGGGQGRPERRLERRGGAVREEHGGDEPHGLLAVVRTLSDREERREVTHCPLRTGPEKRRDPLRRARRKLRRTTTVASAPTIGEVARTTRTPTTPTGRRPSNPPQLTASTPAAASAAPTSPPMSASLRARGDALVPGGGVPGERRDERGGDHHRLARLDVNHPATVSATAAPSRNGPTKIATVAMRRAAPGRPARVAISVGMEFAESWTPFVNAKASASETASTRPASIRRRVRSGRQTVNG